MSPPQSQLQIEVPGQASTLTGVKIDSIHPQRTVGIKGIAGRNIKPADFLLDVDEGRMLDFRAESLHSTPHGRTMSRYTTMTIGFLLVFMGIKFHMVESYLLTPRATKFWVERVGDSSNPVQDAIGNPIAQISNGYNNAFRNNAYSPYNNGSYYPASTGTRGFGATNDSVFQSASYQSPSNYQQRMAGSQGLLARTMYGPQKQLTTPKWLGWPVLFLGAVFILHGAGMRRS